MHSFKEYLELQSRDQGYGYVSVKPTAETIHDICKLIVDSGISNTIHPSELHMTLAYDANNPVMKVNQSDEVHIGTFKEVKVLGDALVIMVDCESAVKRNDELSELGFMSDYPDYLPHISLKYNSTKDDYADVKAAFKQLKLKGKQAKLYNELWEFNTGNYVE